MSNGKPRRIESDPTVPIPASLMRSILAQEGSEPVPDDDTPTSPTLAPLCAVCNGSKVTVVRRPDGGWRGPVPCIACNETGFAPGIQSDPEEAT